MKQPGLFDLDRRHKKLVKTRGFLENLNRFVDWESFRALLAEALKRSPGGKGGRPAHDAVLMFKVLVLQALYSIHAKTRKSLGDLTRKLSVTDRSRRSNGKMGDVLALDLIVPEAGAIYVMDRGYVGFRRLFVIHQAGAFFVTRAKSNMNYHRVYSHKVDKTTDLDSDRSIALDGFYTKKDYPQHLRRIRFCDPETDGRLIFLTDNFAVPAATIAAIYKQRWQVELFFKWINPSCLWLDLAQLPSQATSWRSASLSLARSASGIFVTQSGFNAGVNGGSAWVAKNSVNNHVNGEYVPLKQSDIT